MLALTVVDRESISIALVLFRIRCTVVVEQHAKTGFWSLLWANFSDNGSFVKWCDLFLTLELMYLHKPNLAIIRYLYSIFSLINRYKWYNRTIDYERTTNLQLYPYHFSNDISKGGGFVRTQRTPPVYGPDLTVMILSVIRVIVRLRQWKYLIASCGSPTDCHWVPTEWVFHSVSDDHCDDDVGVWV